MMTRAMIIIIRRRPPPRLPPLQPIFIFVLRLYPRAQMMQVVIIRRHFHTRAVGGIIAISISIAVVVVVVFGEIPRIHGLVTRGGMIEFRYFVGCEGGMTYTLDFVIEFPTWCGVHNIRKKK